MASYSPTCIGETEMKFSQYSKEQRQLAKAVNRINEAMKDFMENYEILNDKDEIKSIAFKNLKITVDQFDKEAVVIRCTWKSLTKDERKEENA